jgi:hypothetical protein
MDECEKQGAHGLGRRHIGFERREQIALLVDIIKD